MTLKEARQRAALTQEKAANLLGVSLRSYKTYENDPAKAGTFKYAFMAEKLEALGTVDETHGLLTLEDIKRACRETFADYPISYCYLFGSYAKAEANEHSDVDLLVSGEVGGLGFFGMVESLREALHKQADVLTPSQLQNNPELLNEILRDGIKVYDKHQG